MPHPARSISVGGSFVLPQRFGPGCGKGKGLRSVPELFGCICHIAVRVPWSATLTLNVCVPGLAVLRSADLLFMLAGAWAGSRDAGLVLSVVLVASECLPGSQE